jgi:hypothetical protein
MRRAFGDAVALALVGGAGLVVVVLFQPGDAALALDAYLLFVGALMLLALTRLTRTPSTPGDEPEVEQRLRSRPSPPSKRRQRLPELDRLEREVALGSAGAFDLHYRLRPVLREVAEHRLLSRRGVTLERDPEAARKLLGEEVWELLRPDRPSPKDRHGRGLDPRSLRRLVDVLERL